MRHRRLLSGEYDADSVRTVQLMITATMQPSQVAHM